MPKLRCFLLFWIAWSAARSAAPDALRTAIEALQKGDAAGAEKILRLEIRARPSDPDALGLLAVVLDQEKKYDEAGKCYQHALALRHVSAALLNNYGNHLLATGQKRDA
ncbi:MAG: hypothetical protein JOZ22_20530, partial [Acidobacteriia bacterium]|nr:hypothetical protein [Terriglobia bacterium]